MSERNQEWFDRRVEKFNASKDAHVAYWQQNGNPQLDLEIYRAGFLAGYGGEHSVEDAKNKYFSENSSANRELEWEFEHGYKEGGEASQ